MSRPGSSSLVCGLLGCVFAASTLLWLKLDRSSPNWDDAWYLTNSLRVYDALTQGGVIGYLTKLNSVFGFKAPLIAALPAGFYLVLGRHWHAAYLVNIVAMWALFAALYRLATRWWSARAAIFAIAIAGTMPLLYGLAQWYMVEYVLTALLAVAACVLIESDGMKRDRLVVLFGAICGFGLLLKITFPLFIFPLFAYIWLTSGRRVRPLLLAALPCLLLALPWYAGHFRSTVAFALNSGFGELAAIYGTGPIFSLSTITTYLSHVAANGVSWYFCCLAVVLTLFAVVRRRDAKKTAAPLLLAWLLPFAVFVFGGNKDIRFLAALLPAAALVLAGLLDASLPRNHKGAAAAAILLAFPMLQMFAVSFGVPYKAPDRGYAHRFIRVAWPHDEILKLIAANTTLGYGEKPMLLMGADRGSFNADNLELSVIALQLPLYVETTAHEKELETLRRRLAQTAFFIYKEGGEAESPAFNPYIDELVRSVAESRELQRIPYERRLPDGGFARIYKNLTPGRP
jgi:hypothetical protein